MTETMALPTQVRLLASWRSARRSDLDLHLAFYDPAPLPHHSDGAWSERFVREIRASRLTGKGGGGFEAYRKFLALRSARGAPTVVVNAMEGEPASAKDRVLLTCVPHLVLDGAQLVAAAVGASGVVVCVADDEPDAAESVIRSIGERIARGLDRVPTEVARPPARFVTGEESALCAWLDGKAAAPTLRIDKSVPLRIGRRPVLVHNAETLAHAALISRHGSAWFRELGTASDPGTTLVTVSGAVEHPGVYEVALGTPLYEIVARSSPTARPAAAVVGGYGGSFLGAGALASGFANDDLAILGASRGAGVIAVVPEGACGVAETARIARYLAGESSGQCGPCMFGLPAIADSLERLRRGESTSPGAEPVLETLRRRITQVYGRGACRHPDGAIRLVASALGVFAEDFAAHASGRPCPGSTHVSVLAFRHPDALVPRRPLGALGARRPR
jgi:NADH:ubiquinone oxidoreductase subunit F (NADH-binding)